MDRLKPARRVTGAALATCALVSVVGLAGPAVAATPRPSPTTASTTAATPTLPVPAATVDPATAIGGPRLAEMGIITDLPAGVPAPPTMRDVAWLVADLDTGNVIAAKAPHAKLAPASTLKTLTALVLIPTIDPKKSYEAADSDTRADGTRIGLEAGSIYTGEQLFQALLMGSANDAAYLLARVNGGKDVTLAQMNAKAVELGALDTHAGDPSGLDAPGQTSSAYDLALIAREAMRDKAFRTYVTTRQVWFPGRAVPTVTATPTMAPTTAATGTKTPTASPTLTTPVFTDARGIKRQTYDLSNHNSLLFNYPGTIGIKNGTTDQARRTYIAAATRGGHTYLVTEMYGLDFQQWRPTARLLDWAFANGDKARPVGRLVERGEALPTVTASAPPATGTQATATASPSSTSARPLAAYSTTGSLIPLGAGAGALALALVTGALGVRMARRRHIPPRH